AYADTYYAYYSDSVGLNKYQKFPAISPRSNTFGLNVIQFTASYTSDRLRSSVGLFAGDIPASAWSPVFNYIQEANIGLRLAKNLWLDAGLFKTHIGTEALLPRENICSSLSIITVYEPWFQSGAKLTYTPTDKLTLAIHVLNGYNTFVETNRKKSVGLTVLYALGDKGTLGFFNIMGDEMPDAVKTSHYRILNNLAFSYDLTRKIKLSAGVDYIGQTHSQLADTNKLASVFSAIFTFRYQLISKLGVYARGEWYSDKDAVLSPVLIDASGKLTGYKISGVTLGLEWKVTDNSYIRLEGRELIMDNDEKIFRTNGSFTNQRTEIMLHTGIWFSK
ncbi:MAG TPA: outer membrane beta-barrel protein, partial [Bacteroidia bacterium]|nr:outer membrane beta-barrel protein [Bacteroidia bacterium]